MFDDLAQGVDWKLELCSVGRGYHCEVLHRIDCFKPDVCFVLG